MRYFILSLLSVFVLASCGGGENEEGMIEEAGRITDEYIEVLEDTPVEARAVKELFDNRNEDLQNELNSIKQ